MLVPGVFCKRCFHLTTRLLKDEPKKRPSSWNLPDLDNLPGGFRGKVYNKRDWTQYLTKNTQIIKQKDELDKKHQGKNASLPPAGWRKRKDLPVWLKNKYALKEKESKIDLSSVKYLSPTTAESIRLLHDQFPNELTSEKLAEFFKVSPIAISKILKSRWKPTEKEQDKLMKRWEKKVSKRVTNSIVENKFKEFIDETENKIKMTIPPFLQQELYEFYKQQSVEAVKDDIESLNEAKLQNEKIKNDKMSGYIDEVINNAGPGSSNGNDK